MAGCLYGAQFKTVSIQELAKKTNFFWLTSSVFLYCTLNGASLCSLYIANNLYNFFFKQIYFNASLSSS